MSCHHRRMEYLLTDADGAELVQLFNEATNIAPRSLVHKDLYLHFRADDGWRCRFYSGDDEGTQGRPPYPTLLDALRAEVAPIIKDFTMMTSTPRPGRAVKKKL